MTRFPSATASSRPATRWRVAAALAFAALLPGAAGAADTLRIAASRAPVSLPLYVAQQRGFFADEHLDVAISDCIGGTRCLRQLLDDKADLATTSEMPVVLQAFAHAGRRDRRDDGARQRQPEADRPQGERRDAAASSSTAAGWA